MNYRDTKSVLIICLTIIVSCVLFISYSEYYNRFSLVSSPDNGLYIFDRKSTMLNRCVNNQCDIIETKFPVSSGNGREVANSAVSKLFGNGKQTMAENVNTNPAPIGNNLGQGVFQQGLPQQQQALALPGIQPQGDMMQQAILPQPNMPDQQGLMPQPNMPVQQGMPQQPLGMMPPGASAQGMM